LRDSIRVTSLESRIEAERKASETPVLGLSTADQSEQDVYTHVLTRTEAEDAPRQPKPAPRERLSEFWARGPHAQRSDDHDCDYRRGSCICRECDLRTIEECAGVSAAEKAAVLGDRRIAKPAQADLYQVLLDHLRVGGRLEWKSDQGEWLWCPADSMSKRENLGYPASRYRLASVSARPANANLSTNT
jgi:hypothetical protein